MGVDEHRLTGGRAQHGDDVAYSGAGYPVLFEQLIARELVANDGIQPYLLESVDQSRPHRIIGLAVGWVRPLIAKDISKPRFRPGRIELTRSVDRPQWRRSLKHILPGHRREQRDEEQRKPPT